MQYLIYTLFIYEHIHKQSISSYWSIGDLRTGEFAKVKCKSGLDSGMKAIVTGDLDEAKVET